MARRLFTPVLVALLLAGCGRPADPLDWKIAAADADQLEAWANEHLVLLPADLAFELTAALAIIRSDTAKGAGGDKGQREQRLARRLDGRTVREALIAGHEISRETTVARIQNQMGVVEELMNRPNEPTPAEKVLRERRIEQHRVSVIESKKKLAEADKRLAELTAGK